MSAVLDRPPEHGAINRVLFEFARQRPGATFIQIGANDGLQRDPLRPYILDAEWSGVLVEPVPYVFERLRSLYDGHPRVTLENVAIADEDATRRLYYLPKSSDPGLPQWYDALASFRKDVLLKHDVFIADIADRISAMDVPCVTFDTLCRRNNIDTVDVIQIDTEGYDYEVIKLIDLDRYQPTVLMYESLHLSEADRRECTTRLRNAGYELLSDGMDTIALRTRALRGRGARALWSLRRLRAMQTVAALEGPAKRKLRAGVDSLMQPTGFQLVRRSPQTPDIVDHRVFNPALHNAATPLPREAEVLRSDSPRLLELRERYSRVSWPVCEHSRWVDERVSQWVHLEYFRGDNIYVWQYRDAAAIDDLRYFTLLRYVLDRDNRSLVSKLGEDGAFGCWTYDFAGYPRCSRDLLDSVNELLFLDRHLGVFDAENLKILDIGAGYGRLAHRAAQALSGLSSYLCIDAVPESTFLSEFYTQYRGVCPPVRVLELPDIDDLEPGSVDLAVNIHSFSECTHRAIEWWVSTVAQLGVPHLFVIPNEDQGFRSTEADGSRLDYGSVFESFGYRLIVEEPVIADEAVRSLVGVNDRFCLFERVGEPHA